MMYYDENMHDDGFERAIRKKQNKAIVQAFGSKWLWLAIGVFALLKLIGSISI